EELREILDPAFVALRDERLVQPRKLRELRFELRRERVELAGAPRVRELLDRGLGPLELGERLLEHRALLLLGHAREDRELLLDRLEADDLLAALGRAAEQIALEPVLGAVAEPLHAAIEQRDRHQPRR